MESHKIQGEIKGWVRRRCRRMIWKTFCAFLYLTFTSFLYNFLWPFAHVWRSSPAETHFCVEIGWLHTAESLFQARIASWGLRGSQFAVLCRWRSRRCLSAEVRRPEDVGTPDSEAKGRNHPLYFVGNLRDLSSELQRSRFKCLANVRRCAKDKEEYYPGRSLIDAVPASGLHGHATLSLGDWTTGQLDTDWTQVSEEPDNDFPVRPVPCQSDVIVNDSSLFGQVLDVAQHDMFRCSVF